MKKTILILSIVSLLFSCNNKEAALNSSKIKELENELSLSLSIIDSLKENNLKNTENTIALTKKMEEGYIPKEYVAFFLKDELKYVTDQKKIVQFFFDHFNLNEWDLDRGYANSYLIESHNSNDEIEDIYEETKYDNLTTKEGLCAYLISKIDRSPESLEKIFSPSLKQFIFSLFKKNNLYKKSGTYSIVKALLYTYQEVNNDDLSRIYESASASNYEDVHEFISELRSEKIKNILSDDTYTEYETWSTIKTRTHLVYTFWARRYHEGNKSYTFNFLLELHKHLTGEEVLL